MQRRKLIANCYLYIAEFVLHKKADRNWWHCTCQYFWGISG